MAAHRPPHRSLLAVGVGLALAVSGGIVAGSSSTSAANFAAQLTVVVSLDGGKTRERFEISCPGAGGGACRSVKAHPDVLWPATDRVCTQIYGGPQRARIRGEVNGRPVDVVIQRNDGCGINDWSALSGVLPRP